jgi:KDO2-lipid IV(A) lauroyltransferase
MRPLKRALRWAQWLVEAIPFFLAMAVFRVIGVDAASAAGGWLARHLAPIAPAHRTARRNIQRALPHLTPEQVEATLSGMWDNLGRTFGEYPHFGRFAGFPNPRIEMVGLEAARVVVAEGKGAITLAGHFANWELMAVAAAQSGMQGCEVYRAINNPLINAWIVRQRRRFAFPLQVPKTAEGTRAMLRALKAGQVVAMLADQKFMDGMPVPFFGRDAMTAMGPAVLSLRTGAAIVPVTMVRLDGARFRMTLLEPMKIATSGNRDQDVLATLTAINAFLEEAVTAQPEQWLWAHNRWGDPRSAR